MTLTFHWWVLPLIIVAVGFIFYRIDRNEGGMFAGLFGGLLFIASICVALAICLGYWMAQL